MRIFLAGASGVVGRLLVPLLMKAGHAVAGTTRSPAKAAEIAALGATPVVVDALNVQALTQAVAEAHPEIVIHQLTDLPDTSDPAAMAAARLRNARLRADGTRNLMAAARAAGVRRVIAQSVAFLYAPGRQPHQESDPLDNPDGEAGISVNGVIALEEAVTRTPDVEGLVLRYGRFYGPGTWTERAPGRGSLHVEAAAHAALLALTRGEAGIYNIAEDDGAVSIAKAREQLGFDPDFRIGP